MLYSAMSSLVLSMQSVLYASLILMSYKTLASTWKVTAVKTNLQSVNFFALVTYNRGGEATRADRLSVSTSCWNVPAS